MNGIKNGDVVVVEAVHYGSDWCMGKDNLLGKTITVTELKPSPLAPGDDNWVAFLFGYGRITQSECWHTCKGARLRSVDGPQEPEDLEYDAYDQEESEDASC